MQVADLEPFTGKIVRKNFGTRNPVGFLEGDPSKLVRDLYPFRYPQVTDHSRQRYSEVINAWTEFGSYPGLRVPDFVPYSDFYVVVNWVEGERLDLKKFDNKNSEEAKVVGGFLGSLVDYSADKFHNGGVYVSDQKTEQYMYGESDGHQGEGVYFVDLDYERGVIDPKSYNTLDLSIFLSRISGIFLDVENKFSLDKFDPEKTKLLNLLDEVLKKHNSSFVQKAYEKVNSSRGDHLGEYKKFLC
jgi:hypothetical protein